MFHVLSVLSVCIVRVTTRGLLLSYALFGAACIRMLLLVVPLFRNKDVVRLGSVLFAPVFIHPSVHFILSYGLPEGS